MWTKWWSLREGSDRAGRSSCGERSWPPESPGCSGPPAGGGGEGGQAWTWALWRRSGCLRSTTIPGTAGRRRPGRGRWRETRPHPWQLVTSAATLSAQSCKKPQKVKSPQICSIIRYVYHFFGWTAPINGICASINPENKKLNCAVPALSRHFRPASH